MQVRWHGTEKNEWSRWLGLYHKCRESLQIQFIALIADKIELGKQMQIISTLI